MRTEAERIRDLKESKDFWMKRWDDLNEAYIKLAEVNKQLIKQLNQGKS